MGDSLLQLIRNRIATPFNFYFVVLTILGVVGNYLRFPLFFGVDILFGSIATLVAIAVLGTRPGLVATLGAAIYTMILWRHPYAGIIIVAEGLFIGLTLKRFSHNLALASGVFWFFLGMPLVFLFYRVVLGMDEPGTELVVVKQAANGVFNAIVANLILSYSPILRKLGLRKDNSRPVFQSIFNIFVASALIPAVILIIFESRKVLDQTEQTAQAKIRTISTAVSLSVERFLEEKIRTVSSIVRIAEKTNLKNKKLLQEMVHNHSLTWTDFLGIFVTDKNGKTIAFHPLKNLKRQSTLGLDFSDRPYFYELKSGIKKTFLSDVFMARGGVFEPVFNVSAAININSNFAGVVAGSMNLREVTKILKDVPGEIEFIATLVDKSNHVIISENPTLKTLMKYDPTSIGIVKKERDGQFFRMPSKKSNTNMALWSESFIGREIDIPTAGGWKLIIETPLSPLQAQVYRRYTRSLGLLLGLALFIMFSSWWIASRISKPLIQLALETTNLPQRLEANELVNWPKSKMMEVTVLVENFRSTVRALKQRFEDLKNSTIQLKAAKEDAETASLLKSAFLANMSHEIRTPLGIMIGYAGLLTDETASLEERKSFSESLKRSGEHVSVLINDILDLSKVEAGYLSIDFDKIALREMLGQLVADFQAKAVQKNLKLDLVVGDSIDDVLVTDRVRFQQIMTNLIGNSIKFTDSGSITLSVLRNNSHLELEVKDTGVGIAENQKEKLFKPFSQVDDSLTRNYGGTGLGLALSKKLSKILKGDLLLSSSHPGVGSVFTLTLENQRAQVLRSFETQPSDFAGLNRNTQSLLGLKTLLVEDSIDNQFLIGRFLRKEGVIVDFANNGKVGVELARKNTYQIIIMDLQMPVMDGYAAIKILRGEGYKKPIIALSAHAMNEVRDICIKAGFDNYLSKPVNQQKLISMLLSYNQGDTAV